MHHTFPPVYGAGKRLLTSLALMLIFGSILPSRAESVARVWNEALLQAIRLDFPAPTVHARNLFHTSVGMYDAWAAYDPVAVGFLHHETATAGDVELARHEAISYAAYRILSARYAVAVDPVTTQIALNGLMTGFGYDTNIVTTAGPTPAAVGNRCAAVVLAFGANDGANEQNIYVDTTGYSPLNQPMIIKNVGAGTVFNANHWQPLAFDFAITQNGLVADKIQIFVSPHWGYVHPFALSGAWSNGVYAVTDPGLPPQLGSVGDDLFKTNVAEVIWFSQRLNPDSGETLDISPASRGNNPLGTNDGTGYTINPATGLAYTNNVVKHGDYGRVIAEFWADGPSSETPPGHWNVLANLVSDHPDFVRRLGGAGPVLGELEWDVKLYLALNGAVHDAAVAAWGIKRRYDYIRPISSIRYMGGLGQSSDPGAASYHPRGLPLIPGLIELITPASSASGQRHAHLSGFINEIAINTWPGEPADPLTQHSGTAWIRAKTWLPYQRDTFVTPAFAGYVSGHSCFSRAGAEVLTAFTGTPYFPGGLGTYTIPAGSLGFEMGPSEDIHLQWATYYDAADEAGISRLYGGIHFAPDDRPGRVIGSLVGQTAVAKALPYFSGAVLGENFAMQLRPLPPGGFEISWPSIADLMYTVEGGPAPDQTQPLTSPATYPLGKATFQHIPNLDVFFYHVKAAEAP